LSLESPEIAVSAIDQIGGIEFFVAVLGSKSSW